MSTFFILLTLAVMPSFSFPSIGTSDVRFRELSSAELESMYQNGSLRGYLNALIQKTAEEKRVSLIHGFLCACLLIRNLPRTEYDAAKKSILGYSCKETWKKYMSESQRPTAARLRERINSTDYFYFGYAICDARSKCHKHIHNDHTTVQVLSKLQEGTTDSIVGILTEEQPQYLLTPSQMKYVNIFAEASGKTPFPYFEFLKYGEQYAVPQVRSLDDMKTCPKYLSESYEYEQYE